MTQSSSNNLIFFSNDLLHKRIIDNCLSLFKDKHFSHAAHEAMKQVEQALRERGLYNKSLFGKKLIRFAFSDKNSVKLEVPLGIEFQEQAKVYFEAVFSYYRNYTAHEINPINENVSLRILIIASELLDLISASSISFKGVETVDALIDSKLFHNRNEFYNLINFLNEQQFPGETFDDFFHNLSKNNFNERQYIYIFELGLVVYKNKKWNHEDPWGNLSEDKFVWIELTPLGELTLQECEIQGLDE